MQKDESQDAGASGLPGSPLEKAASSGGFELGGKLRDKLEKLEKWRIDQSLIEFPKDAPEFRGGNATVVKAFWASSSGGKDRNAQPNPTKSQSPDSNGSEGETSSWWKICAEQFLRLFIATSRDSSMTNLASESDCADREDQSDPAKSQSLDPDSAEAGTSRPRKPVAVKKMNISDDRARVLGLTLREAEFLVDLSDENVIKLEGFVEDLTNDIVWLVFPWEDNGTLRDFIASADWEIPERISLINDVAKGVQYLHCRTPPIRHGDLKSINILVNQKCRAVITDFGSARRLTTNDLGKGTRQTENKPQAALSLEATFCSSTNTMGITLTGDKYTLRWAPPEVLREEEPILESDIWALGWVAYEVMTNSIPFQDVAKDAIVIKRVIQGDLPSITNHARMSLIQALCSVMLACWSIDPKKRPTAEDVRKSLDWMPMIGPNLMRTSDTAASREPSPALLMQLGWMYSKQGDYANALEIFTNALDGYRDIGSRKGTAAALVQLATVHRIQKKYSQAVAFYSDALQILADIGDRNGRASVLSGLAEVHLYRTEDSQAATFYSEVLQIHTDNGNRHGRVGALRGLAAVHQAREEYREAVAFNTEALQICTDIGDTRGRAHILRKLAEIHRLQLEYSQAITLNSESLEISTDIGDRNGIAHALLNLADAHRDQGNFGEAIPRYTEAIAIFEQIGNTRNAVYASKEVAKVRRLSKREEAA